MNIESIWMKDYKNNTKRKNNQLTDTDILIIGGGITGLSCAYFLKDSNWKITLLDKGKIGNGFPKKQYDGQALRDNDSYGRRRRGKERQAQNSSAQNVPLLRYNKDGLRQFDVAHDYEHSRGYRFCRTARQTVAAQRRRNKAHAPRKDSGRNRFADRAEGKGYARTVGGLCRLGRVRRRRKLEVQSRSKHVRTRYAG